MHRYSDSPIRRQHAPKQRDYRSFRPCVRIEFSYRCVYCLVSETEVRPASPHAGFEVDHFRPQRRPFRRLRNAYPNVYWACPLCNRTKGGAWPTPEEEHRGFGFVDPCSDVPAAHLVVEGETVRSVGGSSKGQYTIEVLNLNGAAHRERRRAHTDDADLLARLRIIVTAYGGDQRSEIGAKIEQMEARLAGGEPWDSEERCACCLSLTAE